ncbi:hypothetical protein HJC99_00305 [Candidatus Saccharibacteria bacterium]|nr:hypothetical protein [Candidatus Saccharibacteria bacterium]
MSDTEDNQPQDQTPAEPVSLPPQASPQDTSNWDDRPFTTPSDRIVIETFQGDESGKTVAE